MSHLPTERLAALADEAPTADELAHLATCELCARERAVYTSLLVSAGEEQSRIGVPLTDWDDLRPALVADGVIDAGRMQRMLLLGARRWRAMSGAWQAAAAVVLVAGGLAAGRLSAGASLVPGLHVAQRGVVADTARAALDSTSFASIAEAREARRRSEALFQSASAYLAANDTTTYEQDSPAAIRTRLAALDRVDEAMREAMHSAPADPVINGYYLTTLGQKEATLQQLNAVNPSSVKVNVF